MTPPLDIGRSAGYAEQRNFDAPSSFKLALPLSLIESRSGTATYADKNPELDVQLWDGPLPPAGYQDDGSRQSGAFGK